MKNKYYILLVVVAIVIIIIGGYFLIQSRSQRIENNVSNLKVITNNPEINVFVYKIEGGEYNQIFLGTAPVSLTDLVAGDYFVTGSLNSYYACDYLGEVITINPGQTKTFSVDITESEECFNPGMNET